MDKYKIYEMAKQGLQNQNLTPEEYENKIKKIAKLLKI
jgi:hypothetical protein